MLLLGLCRQCHARFASPLLGRTIGGKLRGWTSAPVQNDGWGPLVRLGAPVVGLLALRRHLLPVLKIAQAKAVAAPPKKQKKQRLESTTTNEALSWRDLLQLLRPYLLWLTAAVLVPRLSFQLVFECHNDCLLAFGSVYNPYFFSTAAVAAAVVNVLIPLEMGKLVEVISEVHNRGLGRLRSAALPLLALYAIQGTLTTVYIGLLAIVGERVARDLRLRLFTALVNQDIAFHDERRSGELVACLSADVQEFKSAFKLCVSQGLRAATQIGGSLTSMWMLSAEMTLGTILFVPVIVGIGTLLGSGLRFSSRQLQDQVGRTTMVADEALGNIRTDQVGRTTMVADEALGNIRTVRAFASEETEIGIYEREAEQSRTMAEKLGFGIAAFQGASNLFLNGIVLGVLYAGASLIQTGQLKPGELMSFLMTTQAIQKSMGQISLLAGQAVKGWTAGGRVMELIHEPRKMPLKSGLRLPDSELRGEIEFRDVHFAYPTRPDVQVFNGLSLRLPSRSTVALCGPSGQGKSTAAALLERFYEPGDGAVLLDGHDLRTLDPAWLRGHVIGFIAQEPVLFSGSIGENIRYGKPDATQAEVEAAARAANAHHFIASFPAGYDTPVGERGASLSGGQKQRIAIARALVKEPTVLILDEATSALDPESEAKVKDALERAAKGRTVLVIAHRLSTIQNADLIALINHGSVAEMGTHEELMKAKGLYYRGVKSQFAD